MDKLTLGQKISLFRKNNSMTQKQFASLLHVSDNVVSKWELGYSEPDLETLKKISQIFNISTDELLNNNSQEFTKKPTFNERAFNFFKNYYILLIQLLLSLFCLLDVTIGYSILSKDIPTLYFALMLGFSIVIFLLDIYIIITKNKGVFVVSIMFLSLFLIIAYLIINCVFYCNVKNDVYEKFFLVSIIFAIITLINCSLNILKYYDVLKCTYPIKFGNIVKIICILFIAFSACFMVGNITTTSVMYAEEKAEQEGLKSLMFYKYEYNFYTIGDQEQIKYIFTTPQKAEKIVDFYSKDESIVTVSSTGLLTAKGYGTTQVVASSKGNEVRLTVNVRATTSSDLVVAQSKQSVYSNELSTITLEPLDLYSLLSTGKNIKFLIRDENGDSTDIIEIFNFTYSNFNYTLTIKAKDYGSKTRYANIIVYDNDLQTYTHAGVVEIFSPIKYAKSNIFFDVDVYAGNDVSLTLDMISENFSDSTNVFDIEIVLKDEEGLDCDDLEIKNVSIADNAINVDFNVKHLSSEDNKQLYILAFDKKTQKYVGYEVCTINDIYSIDACLHDDFYVGESVDIIWNYYPSEVIDDFVITSTDSTVAKVSEDGKIHIKGIGNAVVTITSSNGVSETKEIVVNEPLTISVTVDEPSSPLIGEKRVFTVYLTNSRETYCDISVVAPSLKVLDIKHDKDGSINYYYITTECIDTNFPFAIFSISDENGEIARYVRPI